MTESREERANTVTGQKGTWCQIASRWSGRGPVRRVFLLLALVFSTLETVSMTFGLAIYVAGLFVHAMSKGNLIRNSKLCQDGPYRWVRHPFYLANLLIDTGVCLFAGVPWLAAIYCLIFPLLYFPRIFAEEEVLRSRFGSEFSEYCKRTPVLIPRTLPNPFSWIATAEYENLRRENELSRILRLSSYPFAIVAVILSKTLLWNRYSDGIPFVVSAAATASVLWCASAVIHRYTEDGCAFGRWRALKLLKYAWLVFPLLPCASDRSTLLAWLKLPRIDDHYLWLIGGLLATVAMITPALILRKNCNQRVVGAALTLLAFGCGVIAEQVTLALIFAFLIWLGWYFSDDLSTPTNSLKATGVTSARLGWHTSFAVMAFLLITMLHELYGLC